MTDAGAKPDKSGAAKAFANMMNLNSLKKLVKCWPMPRFASCGANAHFARPRYVAHPHRVHVGRDTYIGKGSSLCVVPGADGTLGEIHLGNRVWISSGLTVYAEKRVVIEDNVLVAGGVFLSDASRGHSTAELPYRDQPNEDAAEIVIGEGSWIGQNCVILPGVTIGRRCIIGSNSVVTTSLPPGSVAVGAPARVVKKWDWEAKAWRKVSRGSRANLAMDPVRIAEETARMSPDLRACLWTLTAGGVEWGARLGLGAVGFA